MKFTINWLKEYLNTSLNLEEIVAALDKAGLPCEKVIEPYAAWTEVEIVKIIKKNKHPNADRLNVYKIEKKDGAQLEVVCGDGSLEVGFFAPYAAPGITVPENGIKIKLAKIRGIESPGMLCAANELMLPIQETGVMRCFADDFGKNIKDAYESQGIIELEITPNKGEALSIKGIARLLSFVGAGELIEHLIQKNNAKEENLFEIKSSDCQAIFCTTFSYTPKSTPCEIAKRLKLVGIGFTNIDLVDTANYISHELGHPMHVFDADKINGKLIVQNLEEKTLFTTLANKEIELEKGTLTICDEQNNILSWPGIIGGNNSKTSMDSKKFIIEAGVFKLDSIQRRKHKITTDSAKRFEYGIDPDMPEEILNTFLEKLNITAKTQQHKKFEQEKTIKFDINYIKKFLGISATQQDLEEKLIPRGYKFKNDLITIPSYKYFDINTQNCIVEEFALGELENIKSINLPPAEKKLLKSNITSIDEIAINNGFFEIYTFSTTKKEHEAFKINDQNRKITNALNNNYAFLRGTLIPHLLKTTQWHINNNQHYRKFFEHGLVYGEYSNKQKTIFTAIAPTHKELLEIFYDYLEKNNLKMPKTSTSLKPWMHEGIIFDGIAACGKIKSEILKEFDLKEYYAIEIECLESLPKNKNIKQAEFPVYKDISFELAQNTSCASLLELLEENKYNFEVFDIYPSQKIDKPRNISIRFKFNEEKTLNKQELSIKIEKIKKLVNKNLNIASS